jgi:hypothetical protein
MVHEIETRVRAAVSPADGESSGLTLVRTKPLKRAESKLEAALKLRKKSAGPSA